MQQSAACEPALLQDIRQGRDTRSGPSLSVPERETRRKLQLCLQHMQKLWAGKGPPSLSASREAVVTAAGEKEEDRERGD